MSPASSMRYDFITFLWQVDLISYRTYLHCIENIESDFRR